MLLVGLVLGWTAATTNGWVILRNLSWYIKSPEITLSSNDRALLVVSSLVFVWGLCMSKRMRLFRLLTKVPLAICLLHFRNSYNIEFHVANHSALEVGIVFCLIVLLLPM